MVICGCEEKGILEHVSVEHVSVKRVFKRVSKCGSKRDIDSIGALCRFRINQVRNKLWWLTVDVRIWAYRVFRLFQVWSSALCSALRHAFVEYGEIDIFKC